MSRSGPSEADPITRIITTTNFLKLLRIYMPTVAWQSMDEHCTNCGVSCNRRYTLDFDGGMTLSDVRLCDPCVDSFRAEGWIDVAKRSPKVSATHD